MYRNLADRLSLAAPAATRLLRACGTPEDILRDGSDYDRFAALAAAMSLCAGHELAASLERVAQETTGLTCSLSAHTAPVFWRAWMDVHWYGKTFVPPEVTDALELPEPVEPTVRHLSETTPIPDPLVLPFDEYILDLAAYTRYLTADLPSRGGFAHLSLPFDADFRRPDPFHAALALRSATQGVAGDVARDILLAQALRILGEAILGRDTTLLLTGGKPETVLALLDYLRGCRRLPQTVWLPADPADAAHVCGLYAEVRTGYTVTPADFPAAAATKRAAYAAVAPIGCAVELIL